MRKVPGVAEVQGGHSPQSTPEAPLQQQDVPRPWAASTCVEQLSQVGSRPARRVACWCAGLTRRACWCGVQTAR